MMANNWGSLLQSVRQVFVKPSLTQTTSALGGSTDAMAYAAQHHETAPDSSMPVMLVSKADIYADKERRVLLLRQGMEVPSDLLPRFIRCGVDPAQFAIKNPSMLSSVMSQETQKALEAVHSVVLSDVLCSQQVVVLDIQQKSIQRTINAFVRLGVNLGKVHPVRMPQYLPWMLEKYQPDILVLDYDLGRDTDAIALLESSMLAVPEAFSNIRQIMMTVGVGAIPYEAQHQFIKAIERLRIDIIFKPITDKAIASCLRLSESRGERELGNEQCCDDNSLDQSALSFDYGTDTEAYNDEDSRTGFEPYQNQNQENLRYDQAHHTQLYQQA